MTRLHAVLVPLLLLACVALTGCGDECAVACGPCAPPLQLQVRRASGELPANVTVEGADVICDAPVGAEVACRADALALGTHVLTVRADDEAPLEVTLTLVADGGGCCSCGHQPITRDVVLGATSDAGL